MLVRKPHTQLTGRDVCGPCQLSLQALAKPLCGVPCENPRKDKVSALDLNVHSVIPPFGDRRLFNVKFGCEWHVSSREILNASSGSRIGLTKSVVNAASDSIFSTNRIRERNPLRTPSRMTPPMEPRQSGHRQIAVSAVESPLRVILRKTGSAPVCCGGYPAQSLSHVTATRGLVRAFHQIRPCFARHQHGRAGASSQL